MELIGGLLQPYRHLVSATFGVMVLQMAMGLAAPWPMKLVLDNVVGHHSLPGWLTGSLRTVTGGDSKMHIAALAALVSMAIAAVAAFATYLGNYLTETIGQRVANDLRTRVYHHLHQLSLNYFDSHRAGPILSTLTDDVDTIQSFASSSTLGMAIDALTIVGMLTLMVWLRWDFTLVAIAVAPLLLVVVTRVRKAVKAATREVRYRQADIVAAAQEGLHSMRLVKAFDRQEFQEHQLAMMGERALSASLKARRVKSVVSPAVAVVVAACTALILWRGSALILAGVMTAGTLTVFIAYMTAFFKPVQDLAKMTNTIAGMSIAVERVTALLDAQPDITDPPSGLQPTKIQGHIEFDHVVFSYGERTVLHDVSFTVAPGHTVGIVGGTGSGKSTLLSLIARFYDTSEGTVRIDGTDVRDYGLHALRRQIAYVLQDTVLFRSTVADNIAFGRADASIDDVIAAAQAADAHDFIMAMPDGYDSTVGDRGQTLSGGQRQRIGIARALIRDVPILLLDEPTAALDAQSEHTIIEALKRLKHGRTVITIAHRLSTIRDADNIVVLDAGHVVEQGTHHQLLARDGTYAALHRLQNGERAT
jgi:subfamily B ATP-binding cassette protein MsbA